VVEERQGYKLVKQVCRPTPRGIGMIRSIKRINPHALLVGSVMSAMAYPGFVVSPIPIVPSRAGKYKSKEPIVVRSDRFTTFQGEYFHGEDNQQHQE
jgi:hypothetical protein